MRRQDGKLLDERAAAVGSQTQVLEIDDAGANALVRQVIAANLGAAPRASAARAPQPAPGLPAGPAQATAAGR